MKLIYVHDPMCSWCWAFRPIYIQLKQRLPKEIEIVRLLGGLAPDSHVPMTEATKNYVIGQWDKIRSELPNIEFNYDFWEKCRPRRSTYPACRAVIAARQQGEHFDELMTYAIQQAYYLKAQNPSDDATLISLADQIGCNKALFVEDFNNTETNNILLHELSQLHQLKLNSFPSLLITNQRLSHRLKIDYHDVDNILSEITQII